MKIICIFLEFKQYLSVFKKIIVILFGGELFFCE